MSLCIFLNSDEQTKKNISFIITLVKSSPQDGKKYISYSLFAMRRWDPDGPGSNINKDITMMRRFLTPRGLDTRGLRINKIFINVIRLGPQMCRRVQDNHHHSFQLRFDAFDGPIAEPISCQCVHQGSSPSGMRGDMIPFCRRYA